MPYRVKIYPNEFCSAVEHLTTAQVGILVRDMVKNGRINQEIIAPISLKVFQRAAVVEGLSGGRRALLHEARNKGTHTENQWRRLLQFHDSRCVMCGAVATSKDHIVPLSRGGSDSIRNIQPACKRCNSAKGNRSSKDLRIRGWRKAVSEG